MTDLSDMIRAVKEGNKLEYKIKGILGRGVEPTANTVESAKLIAAVIGGERADRSGWFHPSQSGTCPRAQMFGYLGVEGLRPDAKLQAIFLDGHWRHLKWQIMLLDAGLITGAEIGYRDVDRLLTGSADGINENDEWILEIKGTSQMRSISEPMPPHVRQVHGYFLLSGYRQAKLLYEDKAYQDFKVFDLECDDTILREVAEEYERLGEHLEYNMMPPVLPECQTTPDKSCAFRDVCLGYGDEIK